MTKTIDHNLLTNEIIERELTSAELEQKEIDFNEEALIDSKREEAIQARKLLLEKLGITEEEAKLLLS